MHTVQHGVGVGELPRRWHQHRIPEDDGGGCFRPLHGTIKHGFWAPQMLECPWRGAWEVLGLEGRVGSDYSGASAPEAEVAWSVPLERELLV